MIRSAEYVLSESPFVVRRTVRWSDCDPAGVAFTGKFTEYLLSAVSLYQSFMAGYEEIGLGKQHGVDMPCKAMSFEFIGTLWPGDVIDLQCTVGEIRQRSFTLHCTARRPGGGVVFKALFSPICVRLDQRIGTPIPPSLRVVLEHHAAANPVLTDSVPT